MKSKAQRASGFPALLAEVRFHLRKGPWRTWTWIADRLQDEKLDREFGIRSANRRGAAELGFSSPDFVHYQPVSYRDLSEMLNAVKVMPDDVFLDFGAGMGRAVCVAATYGFHSVIGIEISAELCAVARQNIQEIKHKLRCKEVQIVHCDAARYEVPQHVSVIYFFNPFGGDVLMQVLENIAVSLRGAPRQLRILFRGTLSSEQFRIEAARHAWLTLHSRVELPTGAVALSYVNNEWNLHD